MAAITKSATPAMPMFETVDLVMIKVRGIKND
jgi:hypothetical protein